MKALDVGKHRELVVTKKKLRQSIKRITTKESNAEEDDDLEFEMTSLEHALHERDKPLLHKVRQLIQQRDKRLRAEIESLSESKSDLERMVQEMNNDLERLKLEKETLLRDMRAAIEKVEEAKRREESVETRLRVEIAALERSQSIELRTAEKEMERLRSTVAELEQKAKRLLATKTALEKQNQALTKQLDTAKEELKVVNGKSGSSGDLLRSPIGVAVGGIAVLGLAVAAASAVVVIYNKGSS